MDFRVASTPSFHTTTDTGEYFFHSRAGSGGNVSPTPNYFQTPILVKHKYMILFDANMVYFFPPMYTYIVKQRGEGEQANAINCREDFPANHHQRPAFPADTMAAMKPELALLGGSLRVPSVQELAKEPLTSLPERYLREGQDPPLTASQDTASPMEIPVIDMQRLLVSSDSTESLPELHKFHYACKDWGFFQVTNTYTDAKILSFIVDRSPVDTS